MTNTPQSSNDVRAAAEQFVAQGWFPIPVPHRRKGPVLDAWQDLRIANVEDVRRYFNGWPQNLGILLGEPSGHLVDVDLDHSDAVALADEYLPPTESEFGRDGKRRSHRLYIVSEPVSTQQWKDDQLGMIVELRSTGVQTVFPPSTHESGEAIRWEANGEPATVSPEVLIAAIDAIANAVRRKHGITASPETTAPATTLSVPADVVDRARKYVAKMPTAISGQGGHDAMFNVACKLVVGFGLDHETALGLMREYNEQCQPPWSEKELAHKVDDALKQPGLRGELLNGASPRSTPQSAGESPRPTSVKEKKHVAPSVEPFKPFPVNALPEPLDVFVKAGATAIGCDPSFIALPLLSVVGAAIGNSRRIQLKAGWTEPAVVWTAVVGKSGSQKTPAFDLVMRSVRDVQAAALKSHEQAIADYRRDCVEYDRLLAQWKRSTKATGEAPEKPEEPQPARFIVSDATVEAMAPILQMNWRGLLMARDELDGWFGGFGEYKGGKGGDTAHWLSMHGGQQMIVDRKTGPQKIIFVPRAAVSITGGIQPGTLRRSLGREHLDSGMAARLLFTMPPKRRRRWNEKAIEPALEAQLACLLDRLRELRPEECGDEEPEPKIVRMTPEAKAVWVRFYDENAREQDDLSDELAAAWSKLEGYAARFALLHHFMRWAAGDEELVGEAIVDERSVMAGVTLSRWFGNEARRIYGMLFETEDERDQRDFAEWIGGRGGSASVRDVQIGLRRIKSSEEAEAALNDLVKAGYGHWCDVPAGSRGGPPTRRFEFHESVNVNTTPLNPEENVGCVDEDGADHGLDDDWAEV